MAIKISLKKLSIKLDFKNILDEIKKHNFIILPITFEHTAELTSMSFYHRDPFDRFRTPDPTPANRRVLNVLSQNKVATYCCIRLVSNRFLTREKRGSE